MTTEDVVAFDECSRKYVFGAYQTPRISLATALNESLRVGLLAGSPSAAKDHLMQLAAEPGLAVSTTDIYGAAVHHSRLIEIIVHYLLNDGEKWHPCPAATVGAHTFQPMSYLMPDQRLRRVVLCSKWDEQRRLEETHGWRTLADTASTGRPMLINAIAIGSATKGFRPSAWTRAYEHPVARNLRVKSVTEGKDFNSNWRKIYREQSSKSCQDWLAIMQADNAFEGIVHSLTVDIPTNAVFEDLSERLTAMRNLTGNGRMRRSACFRAASCVYAGCCYSAPPFTPADAGWDKKKPVQ